jgi:hypothetical protein
MNNKIFAHIVAFSIPFALMMAFVLLLGSRSPWVQSAGIGLSTGLVVGAWIMKRGRS